MPRASAASARLNPIHHSPDGLASSAAQTSRVTSACDLWPAMSGATAVGVMILGSATPPVDISRAVMAEEFQVPDSRLGVEVLEHPVGAAASGEAGDATRRIVQVAEHDGLSRAHLLTRGLDG